MSGLFGHCPNGGGVSTLAQMVWGTYFEKNCPCSKGHLLGLGGLNPCQDGLGHLCSENWSSNGICSSRSGNKVPQSARLSEGGGVQSLFGQCPNRPGIFQTGLPLLQQLWQLHTGTMCIWHSQAQNLLSWCCSSCGRFTQNHVITRQQITWTMCKQAVASTYTMCKQDTASTYTMCKQALSYP